MKMCKVIGSRYIMQIDRARWGTGGRWWSRRAGSGRLGRRTKNDAFGRIRQLSPGSFGVIVKLLPLLHGQTRRRATSLSLERQDRVKILVDRKSIVRRWIIINRIARSSISIINFTSTRFRFATGVLLIVGLGSADQEVNVCR